MALNILCKQNMDVNNREGVARFTNETYAKFNKVRGKAKNDIPFRFWDVVVLTASDVEQKTAYEMQIEGKLRRGEIPRDVDYRVFADPPGPKLGCGGATMHVVSQLTDIYGDRLNNLYVLLINAGGQSQRLISASVLGKIFTALPMGSPPWQVLELKLAAYLPLLARMSPGFLHVASDTIEVYDLGDGGEFCDWNFAEPGLTALAHPSTLDIGATHGVFVFNDKPNHFKLTEFCTCMEVLQKPTAAVMRKKGAVATSADSQQDIVFTDSLYYFDHSFARHLLEFYRAEAPLKCELNSYEDFMQPLGTNSTSDYTSDTKNVSSADEHLVPTRLKLYNHLKGLPFSVIIMHASQFYHLGTMHEYLCNFCEDENLSKYTGFQPTTFCNTDTAVFANNGCVIHSVFKAAATIGSTSVVEYCRFDCRVVIGNNCIISHCSYTSDSPELVIPPNLFLHTIPIKTIQTPDRNKYVTLVFHIDDNMKAKAAKQDGDSSAASGLRFLGKSVSEVVGSPPETKLFAKDDHVDQGSTTCSLWCARLFAPKPSMDEAFAAAMSLVNGQQLDFASEDSSSFLSASEVVLYKDVRAMLDNVQQLYSAIRP